jgi:hypothetical protein
LASNTNSVDLSALTGGEAGGLSLVGFNGADFGRKSNFGWATKLQGGQQLAYTTFNDTGSPLSNGNAQNRSNRASCAQGDLVADTTGTSAGGTYFGHLVPQANSGIRSTCFADQKLRVLRFAMECTGNFRVRVSLSDGSMPDQLLTLPTSGAAWWQCTWRAVQPNSFMNFEIRMLTGTNGQLLPEYAYIGVPTKPARPKGFILDFNGGRTD